MTSLGKHLFETGVALLPAIPKCFDCSEPGTNLVLGHVWCNDCLVRLNEELADFQYAKDKAERDELGRLRDLIRHDFKGVPHEL